MPVGKEISGKDCLPTEVRSDLVGSHEISDHVTRDVHVLVGTPSPDVGAVRFHGFSGVLGGFPTLTLRSLR